MTPDDSRRHRRRRATSSTPSSSSQRAASARCPIRAMHIPYRRVVRIPAGRRGPAAPGRLVQAADREAHASDRRAGARARHDSRRPADSRARVRRAAATDGGARAREGSHAARALPRLRSRSTSARPSTRRTTWRSTRRRSTRTSSAISGIKSHDYRVERFGVERVALMARASARGRAPRYLDVGCSTGFVVEAARDAGWDAIGIDLNPSAIEFGRARGLDLRTVALEDAGFAAAQLRRGVALRRARAPARSRRHAARVRAAAAARRHRVPLRAELRLGVAAAHGARRALHLADASPELLHAGDDPRSHGARGARRPIRRDRGARHRGLPLVPARGAAAPTTRASSEIADTLQFFVNAGAYGKNLRVHRPQSTDESSLLRAALRLLPELRVGRPRARRPRTRVHLSADERARGHRRPGAGRAAGGRVSRACRGTWPPSLEAEPWFDAARRLRARRSTTCACSNRGTPARRSCACARTSGRRASSAGARALPARGAAR